MATSGDGGGSGTESSLQKAGPAAPEGSPAALERLTSEYVIQEDRIRLSGALPGGSVVVFWMTQRLLLRLVPTLLQWLQSHHAPKSQAVPAEVLQSFAQQAARTQTGNEPQSPVRADPSSGSGWVVNSVDMTQSPETLRLTFKPAADPQAVSVQVWPTLPLSAQALRQWLNILYDSWRAAGWPQDIWPDWIRESAAPTAAAPKILH